MPKNFAFAFLLSSLALRAWSASSYPFPQNRAQPFNALYPAYSNADVTAVYNAWKSAQVTSSGAGGFRRVQRNGDVTLQPLSTVSEGIGYGMVIAVYMDDQALFDDLWQYYNLHLDGNGLMNWYISADGATTLGSGAATDADQDVAWALCMAQYQWGTSANLPQPYATYAQSMIGKVWSTEVEQPSMVLKPGDSWGGASATNPSYFDPAHYRVFAQETGNSGWLQVVDECYTVLENSLNAASGNQSNGLVPAWCDSTGAPVVAFAGAPTNYQYDSCRTPFRIAKDWFFFGEPRALSYVAMTSSFFSAIGAAHITDGYALDGAVEPQYDTSGTGATGQSAAFVGPATVAGMAQAPYASFVQDGYNLLKTDTLLIGGPYYDQSWTVMSLLMMSGNYLDYVPTLTPTPTPDACQYHVRVNCAGPAYSGPGGSFSADQAYSTGSWGYVSAPATTVGTSAGPITGTLDPSLYLDERYGTEVHYRFTAPNGPATVTLHFAETYFTSAAQRVFNVGINGVTELSNLDLFTAAGGKNVAKDYTFSTTVTGGLLNVDLVASVNNATIMALEVQAGPLCSPTVSPTRTPNWTATDTPTRTPSPTVSPSFSASPTFSASPSITPTFTAFPTPDACTVVRRVNAGGPLYTDSLGDAWAADQAYSAGSFGYVSYAAGTAATSAGPITNTTDPTLFMTEHYGNPVAYRFDVPNGDYRVRIRLAETYFASAGQRSESISANGVTVLNNVDLFTLTGGKNVAYDLTFTAAATGGQLTLEAWSSNNNGTWMGIELIGLAGCTPTISPSNTRSLTLSATPTPSLSRTGSLTPSSTPTRSASTSPSASPTCTAQSTVTPSPSASPSVTAVPPGSSATSTKTVSVSSTLTPSVSRSTTATPSITLAASPTATATLTSSASATPKPSATVTLTPSASSTITSTVTFSQTPSAISTPTATITPAISASPSVSASSSATSVAAFSATFSPTPTDTLTQTASPTRSPTGSPTPLPSGSLTTTPRATVSAAATTTGSGSTLQIIRMLPVPDPNPLRLAILAEGGPGSVDLKLYSSAMVCIARQTASLQGGWNSLPSPLNFAGLSNGIYFVQVRAQSGKSTSLGLCKLVVLH